jgi:aspartate 1-decarboxylase
MLRPMLLGKIHRATVTDADLHYVGSLTVDRDLLDAAERGPGPHGGGGDVTNGARLTTYVIPGESGSGTVCVNGAAAHLVGPGDVVIVIAYGLLDERESRERRPTVVFVDEANRIVDVGPDPGDAPAGFGLHPSGVRLA